MASDRVAPRTPDSRPPTLALEAFLPYRVSVLANTVSRALARRYAERFGLTISQWRIVAALGDREALSAGEVAERTAMDKVAVSRALRGLVRAGRVLRRTDPADRRRTLLRLSARGRDVYERIVPLARAFEAELLSALGAEDRRALQRVLEGLSESARRLDGQAGRDGVGAATPEEAGK